MSLSFLSMAWWGILLTVLGSLVGAFLLVFGIIVLYLIARGKHFNSKNSSSREEENSVSPHETEEKTIE